MTIFTPPRSCEVSRAFVLRAVLEPRTRLRVDEGTPRLRARLGCRAASATVLGLVPLSVPGVAGTAPLPPKEDATRPSTGPFLPRVGRVPVPSGQVVGGPRGAWRTTASRPAVRASPPAPPRLVRPRHAVPRDAPRTAATGRPGLARGVPRGPVRLLTATARVTLPRAARAEDRQVVASLTSRKTTDGSSAKTNARVTRTAASLHQCMKRVRKPGPKGPGNITKWVVDIPT